MTPPAPRMDPGEAVRLRVRHITRFDYDAPVTQAHSEVRKTPITTPLQKIITTAMTITPDTRLGSRVDHFGNVVRHFNLMEPHDCVEIVAEAVVETTNAVHWAPVLEDDPRPWEQRWAEFLAWSPGVPELPEYGTVRHPVIKGMPGADFTGAVQMLANHFFSEFRYDPDVTHVHSTPQELFQYGGGVCQDLAHAMIGVLRREGIPARYVSGYIYDPKQDDAGDHLRGALATHAWVQTWHPELGWVGIDPTNDKLVDWQYVLVAVGRDYFDVQPVRGVFLGGSGQRLDVSVSVSRD